MATTTTNFGWTVPSDTDLVKNGAAAIRTALGGPDTSFAGLKGGTTGQVLSKSSGTDLAFTWSTPSTPASPGMVYVGGSTFSSSSAVNLNNIFTSTYANYKVVFNCTGTSGGVMQIRFRVSGSDNSTSNYDWQRLSVYGATNAPERQANQTYFLPCTINTTFSGAEVLITNPQAASKKIFLGHAIQEAGPDSTQMFLTAGSFNTTTQFDGMSLFPSAGTITGSIRVYGLANS